MKLEDLPLDILTQILNDDTSFLVIDLWKCGSTALNGKLRRGVVSVSLKHSAEKSTTRYPRCLKEFINLQRLAIESTTAPLCSIPTLRKELRKLPSTLTELSLGFQGVTKALFMERPFVLSSNASKPERPEEGLHPDHIDQPPSSKHLKHEELDHTDTDHDEQWNLDVTWPHMKRLSVYFDTFAVTPPFTVVSRLLPQSLEYLRFDPGFDHPLHDFSSLPPNIKSLVLSRESIDSEGLRCLPQSLTDIGDCLDEQATCLLASEPSLLPNLTTFPLNIDLDPDIAIHTELCTGTVPCPQNLKELVFIDTEPEEIFHEAFALPAELKSLKLKSSGAKFDLNAEWLTRYIPQALTALEVEMIDFKEIELSMWPPHLTSLCLADPKFGPQWLPKLPRTLTSLESGALWLEREYYTADPPAYLASGIQALNGVDKDIWNTIKLSLKDSHFNSGNANEYISAVESGRLFGFPLGLTTLNLSTFTCDAPSSLVVPPQVRKLVLCPSVEFQVEEFFRLLPPSVNELYLAASPARSSIERCIELWDSQSVDASSTWLFQSKSLTRLDLVCAVNGLNGIAKYLPRTLLSLSIRLFSACFSLQSICDLPPSLTSLVIDDVSTEEDPTDGWVALLPRSLVNLEATLPMTGSDFVHLPPGLCYLSTRFHGVVTLDDVLSMPRTLRSIGDSHKVELTPVEDHPEHLMSSQFRSILQDYQPFYIIFQVPRTTINTLMGVKSRESARDLQERGQQTNWEYDSLIEIYAASSAVNETLCDDIDPRTISRLEGNAHPSI